MSWRKRHVAMSPLFTETVSSSLNSTMLDVSSLVSDANFVKATQQNHDFPETVDPGK